MINFNINEADTRAGRHQSPLIGSVELQVACFVLCIFVYPFSFYCDMCSLCILMFATICRIK